MQRECAAQEQGVQPLRHLFAHILEDPLVLLGVILRVGVQLDKQLHRLGGFDAHFKLDAEDVANGRGI